MQINGEIVTLTNDELHDVYMTYKEKIIDKLREDIDLWKPLEDSDIDNDFKSGIRQGLWIAIQEVKRSVL